MTGHKLTWSEVEMFADIVSAFYARMKRDPDADETARIVRTVRLIACEAPSTRLN